MRLLLITGTVVLTLLAAACGSDSASVSRAGEVDASSSSSFNQEEVSVVAGVGTLIQPLGQPPRLCHTVAASLPPGCGGGVEVVGVDATAVPGAERSEGTVWADRVRIVGTYTDGVLTATELPTVVPEAMSESDPAFRLTPAFPCTTPPGGWIEGGHGGRAREVATAYSIQHAETYGGGWWSQEHGVMTLTFTRGIDSHRQALRQLVGGDGVCVLETPARYSLAELRAIGSDLRSDRQGQIDEGIEVQNTAIDEVNNVVVVSVVVADQATLAHFATRYGESLEVSGWLTPV